jgi:hypothetical protein
MTRSSLSLCAFGQCMACLSSAEATVMTDTSLFYESDVTTRSGYGSAPRVLLLRPRSGTPMTPRTTTPDVDVSRHEEKIDTDSPHGPSAPSDSGTKAKPAKSTVKPLIILIAASVMTWAAAMAIHGF